MTQIRSKGKRINYFISDYTVFDLETTDTNVMYAKIVEIGAVKVRDGEIVDTFETLVNPRMPIPSAATAVNGITNEMVVSAPHIEDVLDKFMSFVGEDVLLGHNITTFDTNVLCDELDRTYGIGLKNDFVDTLYIAQRGIDKDTIEDYKLGTICNYFGVDAQGAHRALADCIMTHQCYRQLKRLHEVTGFSLNPDEKKKRRRGLSSEKSIALHELHVLLTDIISDNELTREEIQLLTEWVIAHKHLKGEYPFDIVIEALRKVLDDRVVTPEEKEELLGIFREIIAPVENAKHECITTLEGMHCVITGDFDYGSRSEVVACIESYGGIIDKQVKMATNYVIVGAQGSDAWNQGTYGAKVKKAIEYNDKKNCNIEIIKEEEFFDELRIQSTE